MQKTKKRSLAVTNAVPNGLTTTIYQPNYITNSRYNYTLIQERIFTYVIFYLQFYTKRVMAGEQINQLEIFQTDQPDIKIHVPLDFIVPDSPAQYPKVRKAAQALAGIVVEVPYRDKEGKKWQEFTGLLSVHIEAEEKKRSKYVIVGIKKHVAEMLVSIDCKDKKPQNYTAFLFENAMRAKHKYTPRIYKYLCSWKEKGIAYPIKLQEFKDMLGCRNKYPNYADFKKCVLMPAYNELKEKSDCWFDIDFDRFEQTTEGKVTYLQFKVVTQDNKLTERKLWDNIWYLLRTHIRLSEAQINQLEGAIKHTAAGEVLYKIMELNERLVGNTEIKDHKAYVIKVLLKEFA